MRYVVPGVNEASVVEKVVTPAVPADAAHDKLAPPQVAKI
jgi:hypothetical protein